MKSLRLFFKNVWLIICCYYDAMKYVLDDRLILFFIVMKVFNFPLWSIDVMANLTFIAVVLWTVFYYMEKKAGEKIGETH